VATRIPAHTSVLSESSAHFVTPDPLDLARGIVEVLQNLELPKNLTKTAAMSMAIHWDKNSLQHTLLEAYAHAIKKNDILYPQKNLQHEWTQEKTQ